MGRTRRLGALKFTTTLGPLDQFKNDLALSVRRRVFRQFMAECHPDPPIALPTSACPGIATTRPSSLRKPVPVPCAAHGHRPVREDADWFPAQFPGLTFLEADLR